MTGMKRESMGLGLSLAMLVSPAAAETYYVSTVGDDAALGTETNPWASVDHALGSVQGGDEVLVEDGTYEGLATLTRGFSSRVVVRARNPYRATLRNSGGGVEVLRVFFEGAVNLTVSGFVMSNATATYTCPNGREPFFVVHVQDATDFTLENNIIFGNNAPGRCNELLKINRGSDTAFPKDIVIRGNLFYDGADAGGADLIDSVRPGELTIEDNIFFGSGQTNDSHSFITIKRQAPSTTARSPRYIVRRNVFLNWGGKTDQAFLQFGEDGVAEVEISDALVENNLAIGNSAAQIVGAFQFKGAAGIHVRANTIAGDHPSGAFGFRIGTEGQNPQVSDFRVRNNIFSDPTGTMGTRIFNVYGDVDVSTIAAENNLYWNGGSALPSSGAVTPADDARRVEADPGLATDQSGIVLPRWDENAGAFPSGSTTIREEHSRLVERYGAIAAASPAAGAADPSDMPADDIRGFARDSTPDIGAYEAGATAPGAGGTAGSGAATGTGGTSGSGGAGGTAATTGGGSASGGSAGVGTSTGGAGADGGSAASAGSDARGADEGGCGCRTPTTQRSLGPSAIAALLFFCLGRRRRPKNSG